MRLRVLFATTTCTIVAAATAVARIGETLEECKQRYGVPSDANDKGFYFRKRPFAMFIAFFEGKADYIIYQKTEKNALGGDGADLSKSEIEQLSNLNGGDRVWKRRNLIGTEREWETEDGQLIAVYEPFEKYLGISTKRFLDRITADQKAKEAKALEGM